MQSQNANQRGKRKGMSAIQNQNQTAATSKGIGKNTPHNQNAKEARVKAKLPNVGISDAIGRTMMPRGVALASILGTMNCRDSSVCRRCPYWKAKLCGCSTEH
eukprot:4018873-Amphidinium_carterae.1